MWNTLLWNCILAGAYVAMYIKYWAVAQVSLALRSQSENAQMEKRRRVRTKRTKSDPNVNQGTPGVSTCPGKQFSYKKSPSLDSVKVCIYTFFMQRCTDVGQYPLSQYKEGLNLYCLSNGGGWAGIERNKGNCVISQSTSREECQEGPETWYQQSR